MDAYGQGTLRPVGVQLCTERSWADEQRLLCQVGVEHIGFAQHNHVVRVIAHIWEAPLVHVAHHSNVQILRNNQTIAYVEFSQHFVEHRLLQITQAHSTPSPIPTIT